MHDGFLTVGQRIGLLETTVLRNAEHIDRLESFQDELHGAMALVKFTLGTSILSAVLAVLALASFIATGPP